MEARAGGVRTQAPWPKREGSSEQRRPSITSSARASRLAGRGGRNSRRSVRGENHGATAEQWRSSPSRVLPLRRSARRSLFGRRTAGAANMQKLFLRAGPRPRIAVFLLRHALGAHGRCDRRSADLTIALRRGRIILEMFVNDFGRLGHRSLQFPPCGVFAPQCSSVSIFCRKVLDLPQICPAHGDRRGVPEGSAIVAIYSLRFFVWRADVDLFDRFAISNERKKSTDAVAESDEARPPNDSLGRHHVGPKAAPTEGLSPQSSNEGPPAKFPAFVSVGRDDRIGRNHSCRNQVLVETCVGGRASPTEALHGDAE
jgi:hypothetical protein